MPSADVTEAWNTLRGQIDAHRPDVQRDTGSPGTSTVPVTVLTGFLGAGKSTLLVHLLQNPNGLRIRALVNDVGSLPFDPTFIGASDGIRVDLTNGCGCCATTSDLAESLDSLARQDDCDLIVLEASGAANPEVLAHVVVANPALKLDRVVAVVNGEVLLSLAGRGWFSETVEQQIASSDCLVVSGCDALSESEVESALREAATRAPGRTVEQSGLDRPASHVLVPGAVRGASLPVKGLGDQHKDLSIVTVQPTCSVPRDVFLSVITGSRPGLLRAKGRLILDGHEVLVQVTPTSVEVSDADEGPLGVTLISNDPSDVDGLIRVLRPFGFGGSELA